MARRVPKTKTYESNIADAVSTACGELTSLAEECREVVDNAPDGLRNSQRIETLDETASQLENMNEPDIDDAVGKLAVSYTEFLPTRRGLSRSARRDNATMILDACINVLQEVEGEHAQTASQLAADLETIKDDAEGAEFPGMFG